MVYRSILEELGQNLITARSGEEALKLVLKHEFAVILLDVNMPGMNGFETATLIRNRKKSSHTPIIFLTAFTDEVRMAQGYASGAVDYLPTPVVPEILKAKVKRLYRAVAVMRRQAAFLRRRNAPAAPPPRKPTAARMNSWACWRMSCAIRWPPSSTPRICLLRRIAANERTAPAEELGDIIDRQVKAYEPADR